MKANVALTNAMAGANRAMQSLNASTNITQTLADFAKQSELMDMHEEYGLPLLYTYEECLILFPKRLLDDLLEDSEEEEAAQEIVDSVFDEIGLEVSEKV